MPDQKTLLILARDTAPATMWQLIGEYKANAILTDSQELQCLAISRVAAHHIDGIPVASPQEAEFFEHTKAFYNTLCANAKQNPDGLFGLSCLGVTVAELIGTTILSNVFFMLRRFRKAEDVLMSEKWDRIVVRAPLPNASFNAIIRSSCAAMQLTPEIVDGFSANDVPPIHSIEHYRAAIRHEFATEPGASHAAEFLNGLTKNVPLFIVEPGREYVGTAVPVLQNLGQGIAANVLETSPAPSAAMARLERDGRLQILPVRGWLTDARRLRLEAIASEAVWRGRNGNPAAEIQAALPDSLASRDAIATYAMYDLIETIISGLFVLEQYSAIISTTKPSVIVPIYDQTMSASAAIGLASDLGLPTFYVNESYFADNSRASFVRCCAASALDDRHKSILLRHSVGYLTDVIVTGLHPRLEDALAQGCEFSPVQVRRTLNFSPEAPFVVFAAQPLEVSWQIALIDCLCEAFDLIRAGGREVGIVIALHPDQSAHEAEMIRRRIDNYPAIRIAPQMDIMSLTVAADAVVSAFSTVLFEAALRGRPAISLTLKGEPPLPFAAQGIAMDARSAEDLARLILDIVDGGSVSCALAERRRAYFEAEIMLTDGRGAARVAEAIKNAAHKSTSA